MAGETKERILEAALELFAQSGYSGTSMNDIAKQLGITKGALYKHYTGKQEILDRIVERMNQMDYERAEEYEMPETEPDGFAEAYLHTPIGKIRSYSMAQLALEFYGPMFLLYSVYDGTEEKSAVSGLLSEHIDRFIRRMEAERMDVK
ncbi:TetR/AcrR family transcriptional regulator [Clostridium sp. OF09-10]|nr:helix-turn-helix domain-containing protein [Clostridium sp. OF09-10]RHV98899.1 TetR/AcrR family transcriptional regulator [Clostridium sp. OF09-10]